MIPLRYNVRSLWVRKTTTIATVFGIALVVFVLAAAFMLAEGIQRTLGAAGSPDRAIVLRKGSDAELSSSIENSTVGLILSAPGVKKNAAGRPMGVGELVVVIAVEKADATKGEVSNLLVRGVPDNILEVRDEITMIAGRPAQPGTDEVIIGARIRGRFKGVDLGKSFELKKNRPVTVVGVFEAGGSSLESEVLADIETVRTSFGRDGLVSSVTVRLESPTKVDGFTAAVENEKQLQLNAQHEPDYFEKQGEGMSIFILAIAIFVSVLFGIAAIFGAVITMNTAVVNRRREIGTMLALGFSGTAIFLSFLLEAILLASVAALVGVVAAFFMSFASFSMVNFVTWSEIVFSFNLTPDIVVRAVIFGAVMGLLGGLVPAWRASRLSPIEAMRG